VKVNISGAVLNLVAAFSKKVWGSKAVAPALRWMHRLILATAVFANEYSSTAVPLIKS